LFLAIHSGFDDLQQRDRIGSLYLLLFRANEVEPWSSEMFFRIDARCGNIRTLR